MKVLIALDGSPCSKKAVEFAADRAWHADDSFLVLSVLEPMPHELGYGDADLEAEALAERAAHREADCETLVDEAREILAAKHPELKIDKKVVRGLAVDTIISMAEQLGIGLIIVGSHGRKGLEKFLVGSVAERILHQAPCAVEIVKHHG
ncbi:MAG: universal stress protein [Cyanobacteria bacterium HKST-UBA02]|nr:universal stress protein [Cyanobacteria bacterium HKST-UBA02]